MSDKYLKLFNITSDSTLTDIKKNYRILAKQNHPDSFINIDKKKKQEKIMAQITETYKSIISNFENLKNNNKPDTLKDNFKKSEIETDYTLYKKGIDYYKIYFDGFFQLFSKRILKTSTEKIENLIKSRYYFIKLLEKFPKSDWIFDTKEKLKKIEKVIENLKNSLYF